jgi:glycosyltransferase involved in cell wall biosynthesis
MDNNKKIKILFIIPHLDRGGSERMITNLCNNLNRKKFDITLLLIVAEGEYLHLIHDDIKIIDLRINKNDGTLKNTIKCLIKIPEILRKDKPNIVMSTITHINIIMAIIKCFQTKHICFIARESNILSYITKQDPFYLRVLYFLLYKKFVRIIAQSKDMKEDMVKNYSVPDNRITIINNFIDDEYINIKLNERETINMPCNKINLLSVGRLEFQKGYDLLLDSFSKFPDKNRFHLTILGKGIHEKDIRSQIKVLALDNYVTLLGFSSNPYKYMAKADIFISSSRFEGFPNVVIEALACGLPVIANNYQGGINEILDNHELGYIINIEDSVEFHKAIDKCIEKDRAKIRIVARNRYSKNSIIKHYETLFINEAQNTVD